MSIALGHEETSEPKLYKISDSGCYVFELAFYLKNLQQK